MNESNEETRLEVKPQETLPPALNNDGKFGFVHVRYRNVPEPPRKPRWLLFALIGASVVVLALIAGLIITLTQGVVAIDLTNWSESDARLWAGNNGINLRVDGQYSDEYDKDKVMAQDVKPGKRVGKGGFIGVTVSKGHDPAVEFPLPDFMTMTKVAIDAWAAENFMLDVSVTAEYSDTVSAGNVISFQIGDPSVIDRLKRGTPVSIVVSKGKEDLNKVLITLPDFTGKTVTDCTAFANENGISLKIDAQYDDFAPKGTVTAQSIKPNEKVKSGSEVTVTVSKGQKVLVPDFKGCSKQAAADLAEKLGIIIDAVDKYADPLNGEFVSQSIAAGTTYGEGDIVHLVFSLGNQLVMPSFIGKTLDVIQTWVADQNGKGAAIELKVAYTQNDAAQGNIIAQDKVNTAVDFDAKINVTVSQGKLVYIPAFVAPAGSAYGVAITREKAATMCQQLGIVAVFVEAKKSGRLPGEVWSQSIASGKEVAKGTTITLKYTPNKTTVTIPDFSGMTKAEILAAGYNKKLDITFVTANAYVDGYPDKVYQQSQFAGAKVAYGSAITLTISPNPPPAPT